MLVLTRKINEAILIDNDIVVRLIEIKGGQIKIGIEAPYDVLIYREELKSKHNHNSKIMRGH